MSKDMARVCAIVAPLVRRLAYRARLYACVAAFLLASALGVSPTQVKAQVVLPTTTNHQLGPGSQYEIMFTTDDMRDGTSANIADYNAFVNEEAALSPGLPQGVSWQAVVSTPTVDANVNAPAAGIPIYNTSGQFLSSGSIYSGSNFNNSIYNQYGLPSSTHDVWTGSLPDGTASPNSLGNQLLPGQTQTAVAGNNLQIGGNAITYSQQPTSTAMHLYALSSPITVPSPPPPPPGLHPGDVYERIFVTSFTTTITTIVSHPPASVPLGETFGGIDAADYWTTFAASHAGLISNWDHLNNVYHAVLSDSTVNAKDRLDISGPVYNMQNELVATSAADLWDGTLLNAIRYDEFGNAVPMTSLIDEHDRGFQTEPTLVWTGSDEFGNVHPIGDTAGNWTNPNTGGVAGDPFATDRHWMSSNIPFSNTPRHLYGISPPITVVPEPSSVVLIVVGTAAFGLLSFTVRSRSHLRARTAN
jgi:hypothetical protein